MQNKKFFDKASAFFDNMTNSPKVINSRKIQLQKFLTANMKKAADLGCGTGNDSIALSLNGLKVDGFDISNSMIKTAKINSQKYTVNTKYYNKSIDGIPSNFYNKYDIAVSLGNSIANVEKELLLPSFRKIYRILKHNSIFIMQILNFDAIKKANQRIINITKNSPDIFVRFYDSFAFPMNFNILRFDENNMKNFELLTTVLYPYDKDMLISNLRKAGFTKVSAYSDLDKNKFLKYKSKDLVLVAEK
jgi:ubiquinone/menaquinone biosynthesis C-methylase UbiE